MHGAGRHGRVWALGVLVLAGVACAGREREVGGSAGAADGASAGTNGATTAGLGVQAVALQGRSFSRLNR